MFRITFSDPMIQELHLFLGMEPMLATGHDGQVSMVLLGKCRYHFNGCCCHVRRTEYKWGHSR